MKHLILSALLTALPLGAAFGQSGHSVSKSIGVAPYIPDFTNLMVREPSCLSPQVTELMKYDDHASAVSNTGTVTSTINLVHFTDKDFDFPVSLTYNSSGFRPRNPDNYVGRDWMLNAGGVVYRQVYGIPDDVKCKANDRDSNARHGFRKVLGRPLFNMQAMREEVEKNPYKYAQVEIEDGDTYARIPNIEEIIEPSPDVFYFSFGKHSGKFMINYDGSVSAVGFNGGKYEVDLFEMQMFTCVLFTDTYIRIKTDDGYVYTFGGGGYSSLEYKAFSWKGNNNCPTGKSTAPYEITAYHLTEITAPNGRTLTIHYRDVDLNYHQNQASAMNPLIAAGSPDEIEKVQLQYQLNGMRTMTTDYGIGNYNPATGENGAAGFKGEISPLYQLNKIALIDRIETDKCSIKFEYSLRGCHPFPENDTRLAFYAGCGAKLDKVTMHYNGATECARLTYEYALGNRMFLKSVKTDAEGTFNMEYNVTPSGNEVPDPLTCNIDHWGFWRGPGVESALIPGMRYSNSPMGFSLDYVLTSSHRNPTGICYDTSLLKRMTFPSGGSVEMAYEPHRYSCIVQQTGSNSFYPYAYYGASMSEIAGGARIRSLRYTDDKGNPMQETVYTYGSLSREGKVTYMPFYRHLRVVEDEEEPDTLLLQGVAFSSEGFFAHSPGGTHIRYPEVTEHYIDPSKGGLEQKHACKKMEFQTFYGSDLGYYYSNRYFFTLGNSARPEKEYQNRLPKFYETHLKELVSCPSDDISVVESKLSRETYYDENGVVRRKVECDYDYLNRDNYSLCLFKPAMGEELFFGMYSHIKREYFRMYLPVEVRTTDYYGERGEQAQTRRERMRYDADGYVLERLETGNDADTLVTVNTFQKFSSKSRFKILQVKEEHYLDTPKGRKKLESLQNEYGKSDNSQAQYPDVLLGQSRCNGEGKETEQVKYSHHDIYGNPMEAIINETEHIVSLWCHKGRYPLARIENATYEEVADALGTNPADILWTESKEAAVETLRKKLPHARVYSYQTNHGNDITTVTSPNGQSTFFDYTSGGRLLRSYRMNERGQTELLQVNDYHFAND